MLNINIVMMLGNVQELNREWGERYELVQTHARAMGHKKVCHCPECDRFRDEMSKISARIREMRAHGAR